MVHSLSVTLRTASTEFKSAVAEYSIKAECRMNLKGNVSNVTISFEPSCWLKPNVIGFLKMVHFVKNERLT
jgi:hypothetical protein